jgi:hypothetical protein
LIRSTGEAGRDEDANESRKVDELEMPTLELTVLEEKLEDFQVWFRENNPRSKKARTCEFLEDPGQQ